MTSSYPNYRRVALRREFALRLRSAFDWLREALRTMFDPFVQEDVTDRLRVTVERLEANRRERPHV